MSIPISNKNKPASQQKKAKVKPKEKKIGSGKSVDSKQKLMVNKPKLNTQKKNLITSQTKPQSIIDQNSILFDLAPIAYYILDLTGKVIFVNKKGISLLEGKKDQIVGKYLSIFINSKALQNKFKQHRKLAIEKERPPQFECELKKLNGSLFFGLIDCIFFKADEHNSTFFLSTITDISELKIKKRLLETALNREKELSRMKSQFVSIASHEFRTPLATILTSAELIEKYNKTNEVEKKEKHFRKIKTSVSRMKEILMDFLSVDEVEKGKITNSPETFNLIEFIKYQIEETKQFNGIHTQNYEHIGKFEDACLDKKLLKTCLTNLIINAYKYSPEGGVIQIISKQTSSGNIEIKVIDKGIGIPKQDQEHIFSRFFRAKNAENTQGTGLGLNITRDLLKLMGGTISFISDENNGTTFTLKFTK